MAPFGEIPDKGDTACRKLRRRRRLQNFARSRNSSRDSLGGFLRALRGPKLTASGGFMERLRQRLDQAPAKIPKIARPASESARPGSPNQGAANPRAAQRARRGHTGHVAATLRFDLRTVVKLGVCSYD